MFYALLQSLPAQCCHSRPTELRHAQGRDTNTMISVLLLAMWATKGKAAL